MRSFVILYWSTVFLMYFSQTYHPVDMRLCSHNSEHSFLRRKSDVFMIAIIVWLSCFSFLRTSFNDTGSYIFFLETAQNVDEFLAEGRLWELAGNPLSYLYESIMHTLSANYHVYFMIPAVLNCFAVIKLFKRYSLNPAFSLLIFFSIGTYTMYIAALKQSIAIFFLLMSIPYAEKKQYIQFYLLVIVAILFHTHAFMFAILPLLFEKPWGKITWLGLAAVLFAMATYDVTLGAFMNYAQSIGALVSEEEVFDGHAINTIRVLVYWVPAALALIFRKRLFNNSSRIENLFVNMSIVSAFILMIGLVEGANLYARMAGYFEIAMPIALAWMINKVFTKQSARLVSGTAAILYFGYFIYEFTISKPFNTEYSAISIWQFVVELFT